MASIIPFPSNRRAYRGAAAPTTPAVVHAFPLAVDLKMVAAIAEEMRGKKTEEAAEAILGDHLEVEAYRLDRAGIPLDEIESALGGFARLAWQAYDRSARNDMGASA